MYAKTETYAPSILLVKTVDGASIGAFLTASWSDMSTALTLPCVTGCRSQRGSGYFGNGECFVFQCAPFRIYRWVGVAIDAGILVPATMIHHSCGVSDTGGDLFQHGTSHGLSVGGGGAGKQLMSALERLDVFCCRGIHYAGPQS